MQAMQRLAPEIKALQEKYKDDKQRQQQEMMAFYKEHQVNPFGSCLPLLLQLPVFISLFYMLRKDLKLDICPEKLQEIGAIDIVNAARARRQRAAAGQDGVRDAGRGVPLHPGHHRQGDRRGPRRADRALRRLAAALEHPDVGLGRPQPAAADDRPAVPVRDLHHPLPGRPDRLLDHDELLDGRPAVPDASSDWDTCARH